MNQIEFQNQMGRLKEVYGDRQYPDERVRLIWKEVAEYSGLWFDKTVSGMIATQRQAPLVTEFREACSAEKEKARDRKMESQVEKDRSEGRITSTPEEQSLMFETIRKRLRGQVSDQDWKCFKDLIQTRFGKQ